MLRHIFQFNDHNRERVIADFARACPPNTTVLDAGSGTGRHAHLFAHCFYESADFMKSDMKYGAVNYVCDLTQIPVANAHYDFILCSEVLEHVEDPGRVLEELTRVLKRRGHMLITAPLMSGIHMEPHHYCAGFSDEWYKHQARRNCLRVLSMRSNGGFFALYGQESQRAWGLIKHSGTWGWWLSWPLALWLKLIVPIACYYLDTEIYERRFSIGRFVTFEKRWMAQ